MPISVPPPPPNCIVHNQLAALFCRYDAYGTLDFIGYDLQRGATAVQGQVGMDADNIAYYLFGYRGAPLRMDSSSGCATC